MATLWAGPHIDGGREASGIAVQSLEAAGGYYPDALNRSRGTGCYRIYQSMRATTRRLYVEADGGC